MATSLMFGLALCGPVLTVAQLQQGGILPGNVRKLMQPGGDMGDGGDGGPGDDMMMPGGAAMPAGAPAAVAPITDDVALTPNAGSPTSAAPPNTGTDTCTLAGTEYCDTYSIEDTTTGTSMVVTVSATARDIESNAIPDFDTGYDDYITADEIIYSYPVVPVWSGSSTTTRQPGISIHGIPFDPAGQDIDCDGEALSLEQAINIELGGVDLNGAHVGEGRYHYHGVPTAEINATDSDLVHAGFATDGYMVYYSKSAMYTSSYSIIDGTREVFGDCTLGFDVTPITLGETPDGGIEEDWEYVEGAGNLDECNGVTVDGEYAYFITDTFPFIPRCLNGEFEDTFEAPDGLDMVGSEQGAEPGEAPGAALGGAPGEAPVDATADVASDTEASTDVTGEEASGAFSLGCSSAAAVAAAACTLLF